MHKLIIHSKTTNKFERVDLDLKKKKIKKNRFIPTNCNQLSSLVVQRMNDFFQWFCRQTNILSFGMHSGQQTLKAHGEKKSSGTAHVTVFNLETILSLFRLSKSKLCSSMTQ